MKKYLITSKDFYKQNPEVFLEVCSEFKNLKAFVHGDYKLAFDSHARGVHLTSNMFDDIAKAKELGLEVIISTHTHEEVFEAQRLGADYVTYSPIFFTPHKGEPKGLEDLRELLNLTSMKIFALGGITDQKQVDEIEKVTPYGFASIRFYN